MRRMYCRPPRTGHYFTRAWLRLQNMLDFDYCCKRPTPSVAGMIYPFGGDSVQKFYWGTSEILLPVYKVNFSKI